MSDNPNPRRTQFRGNYFAGAACGMGAEKAKCLIMHLCRGLVQPPKLDEKSQAGEVDMHSVVDTFRRLLPIVA